MKGKSISHSFSKYARNGSFLKKILARLGWLTWEAEEFQDMVERTLWN